MNEIEKTYLIVLICKNCGHHNRSEAKYGLVVPPKLKGTCEYCGVKDFFTMEGPCYADSIDIEEPPEPAGMTLSDEEYYLKEICKELSRRKGRLVGPEDPLTSKEMCDMLFVRPFTVPKRAEPAGMTFMEAVQAMKEGAVVERKNGSYKFWLKSKNFGLRIECFTEKEHWVWEPYIVPIEATDWQIVK